MTNLPPLRRRFLVPRVTDRRLGRAGITVEINRAALVRVNVALGWAAVLAVTMVGFSAAGLALLPAMWTVSEGDRDLYRCVDFLLLGGLILPEMVAWAVIDAAMRQAQHVPLGWGIAVVERQAGKVVAVAAWPKAGDYWVDPGWTVVVYPLGEVTTAAGVAEVVWKVKDLGRFVMLAAGADDPMAKLARVFALGVENGAGGPPDRAEASCREWVEKLLSEEVEVVRVSAAAGAGRPILEP